MKSRFFVAVSLVACVSVYSAEAGGAATTKRRTPTKTKQKPKPKPTTTTKKPTTEKIRTLNICDLMSGINFGEVLPGKTLGFLRFMGEPRSTRVDEWKSSDLSLQARLPRTVCEFYANVGGIEDDYVGVGQEKLRGAALREDLAKTGDYVSVQVPGIDGTVLQEKGKMRFATGAAIPDNEVRRGRACIVVYESPKGTFGVTHQLFDTATTADGMSCEVAYETLRRTMARVASGNVSALPT
jgi:hypothetical protein